MTYGGLDIEIGKKCNISKEAIIGYRENGKGKIRIGNNVRIDPDAVLRTCGGTITIEDGCHIGMGTIIFAGGNVQIRANTLISPRVQIYAQNHGIYRDELIKKQKQTFYGIWIDQDCWIGAGTIITDACRIEKGVVVGAGSVVTKSLPSSYTVYAGNPAKYLKERPKYRPMPFASEEVMFPEVPAHQGENKTPVSYPEDIPGRF